MQYFRITQHLRSVSRDLPRAALRQLRVNSPFPEVKYLPGDTQSPGTGLTPRGRRSPPRRRGLRRARGGHWGQKGREAAAGRGRRGREGRQPIRGARCPSRAGGGRGGRPEGKAAAAEDQWRLATGNFVFTALSFRHMSPIGHCRSTADFENRGFKNISCRQK